MSGVGWRLLHGTMALQIKCASLESPEYGIQRDELGKAFLPGIFFFFLSFMKDGTLTTEHWDKLNNRNDTESC